MLLSRAGAGAGVGAGSRGRSRVKVGPAPQHCRAVGNSSYMAGIGTCWTAHVWPYATLTLTKCK